MITPDTLIPDLLETHPQTRPVLDRYGLHGCGGAKGPYETIRFFARAHGVEERGLIRELETAVGSPPSHYDTAAPLLEDMIYRRFFKAGIVFVLTAGASWGAWLLWSIGLKHSFTSASIHHINAHGHAQIFGWVGLFVMGFAYQAFPRFKHTRLWRPEVANWTFYLMTTGIALRVISEPFHTRVFFFWGGLAGGFLEILAAGLFVLVTLRTYARSPHPLQTHDWYILAALFWFFVQALGSTGLLWLTTTASPGELISRVATFQAPLRNLQIHGFALLMILGVSQRFLPGIYGFASPSEKRARRWFIPLNVAIAVEALAILLLQQQHDFRWAIVLYAAILLLTASVLGLTLPWKVWGPCSDPDRSLKFIRMAFPWLYLSLAMLVLMPLYSRLSGQTFSHAYYGASRHAITVGFISLMILGVASKVVPTLAGRDISRLNSLMLPFALVNIGCLLRVTLQTTTDFADVAFPMVGISGLLEVTGIGIWGIHLWRIMNESEETEEQILNVDESIGPQTRVGLLVDRFPATLPIFYEFGFDLLRRPYLRRTLARVTTIRQACSRLRVNEDRLLQKLNDIVRQTNS